MEASNNLLKNFCQSIGMSPLGFDEDNLRSLSFDDKIIVTFIGNPNDDELVGLAYIGDVSNDSVLRVFMEQNFIADAHGGARFAIEPKTNRIVMSRSWDAVKTTVEGLSDDLETLVNSAMRAKEFLDNGGVIPTQTASNEGESAPQAPVSSLNAYESL